MSKRNARAIVLSVFVVAAGLYVLSTNPRGILSTVELAAAAVPIEQIAHGTKSMVKHRVNYIITTPEEFTELWNMTDAGGTPPAIDFARKAVLAVFAGEGVGADISVMQVQDTGARTVTIAVKSADGSCSQKDPKEIVSPYELVVVPKTSLPLTHEDVVTTLRCPK